MSATAGLAGARPNAGEKLMSRIPNLFIVGAPKCGTTALWSYLGSHPDIFSAGKEYHYFGSDLVYRNQSRLDRESYLAYFSQADQERYLLDASVGYLVSERAAVEIASFSPDCRIIAILRDPIDMMHSLHSELLFQGDEDVADFGTASGARGGAQARRTHSRLLPIGVGPLLSSSRPLLGAADPLHRRGGS